MSVSLLAEQVVSQLDALARKSQVTEEYRQNIELQRALHQLGLQSLANLIARQLDGPDPRQRTDADRAREKPFRVLGDRETDAYAFETVLREGFVHSAIPTQPYHTLEAYPRMRFFETVFPRSEPGVDDARLSPLQQVHKSYMKKVYDGGMAWDEFLQLTKHHQQLKHLSSGFNLEHRLAAFIRSEAATEFLKAAYTTAAQSAGVLDPAAIRPLRVVLPAMTGSSDEIAAARLRQFASGGITKEDHLLLGAIEPDKKLMKRLLDTLSVYQFTLGLIAAEADIAEQPLAPHAAQLRADIDTLIGKLVEHGGEKHSMSERGKMRQTLLDWLAALERYAKASPSRVAEASAGPSALPPAADLWG